MNQEPAPQIAGPSFDAADQIGSVELDRYCTSCGYNLRQQAIRREPTTRLLLCKCPECGDFEPANTLTTATRSWFRFLVVLAWLLWLVVWLNLIGWSIFSVSGLAVVSGDVRYNWVDIEQAEPGTIANTRRYQDYLQNIQNQNPGTNNYAYHFGNYYDLAPITGLTLFGIALTLAGAAAIGALLTTITTVAMPHWRRWAYILFACAWPLVGIVIVHGIIWPELYEWRIVTHDLIRWHTRMAISLQATALLASLAAVWLGRPVTRVVIRVIVPPKRRGVFAYLWLADGKAPPKTI